jgi:hypothetical protein
VAIIIISIFIVLIVGGYFSVPSVNYRVKPYTVQKNGDEWVSYYWGVGDPHLSGSFLKLHVANRGLFDASFTISLKATNASFNEKPVAQAQLVGDHYLKIPYTLRAWEETETTVYFSVDNSLLGNSSVENLPNWFEISVDFESNQLLIRSTEGNWMGQNTFRYYESRNDTWVAAMIS